MTTALDFGDEMAAAAAGVAADPFHVVRWDSDLERVLALPRRPAEFDVDVTETYRLLGSRARLRPIQSRALWDMAQVGGLVGGIGVGWGKELIALLAPTALNARRPLLLNPPQLVSRVIEHHHPTWSREFRILPLGDARAPRDGAIHVASYHDVSVDVTVDEDDDGAGEDLLMRVMPDLVVLNEAHHLARGEAARTRRFRAYFRKVNPACKLVALSGTLTSRGPADMAVFFEFALRHWSPLPRGYAALKEWDEALGSPRSQLPPRAPGALLEMCSPEERAAVATGRATPRDAARAAFRRRLAETPGVVLTSEGALGCSLVSRAIRRADVAASPKISAALADLRRRWVVGGLELDRAAQVAAVARQLSQGFYYRWAWPGGQPDLEYLSARNAWSREVRDLLHHRARPGMDSPGLLAEAAAAGRWKSEAWAAWAAVKDRRLPPVVAEWVDPDYLPGVVDRWLGGRERPALVWYRHEAAGARLAEALGLPLAGEGDRGARALEAAAAARRTCLATLNAHAEGKDFLAAAYARALCVSPPSSGKIWEQMVGRLHRPGQPADEVQFDVLADEPEVVSALAQARADALYLQETGGAQKLLYADLVGWPEARR